MSVKTLIFQSWHFGGNIWIWYLLCLLADREPSPVTSLWYVCLYMQLRLVSIVGTWPWLPHCWTQSSLRIFKYLIFAFSTIVNLFGQKISGHNSKIYPNWSQWALVLPINFNLCQKAENYFLILHTRIYKLSLAVLNNKKPQVNTWKVWIFKIKILIPNTCWLHMIRMDVRNLIVGVILDILSIGLCCRWASSSFIQFLSCFHSEMTTKLDATVFGVSSLHKFWQIWTFPHQPILRLQKAVCFTVT